MNRLITFTLLCCVPLSTGFAQDDPNQARIDQSKTAIQEFMGKLKAELETAIKAGGPINAIQVCNKSAPAIAKDLSEKHAMQIARTSLKTRNPDNAPDAWEAEVLNKFEARKAAGENPDTLTFSAVVEHEGKLEFRFMKAIVMPPVTKMPCLKCHGENIDPKIAAKLDELYPKDQARGYKAGDVRGAFTVRQPM